jgi:hypothetical protein
MHRLVFQSRVATDSVLHVAIPKGEEVADRQAQVTIDPVEALSFSMAQQEWRQFAMEAAGSIIDPSFGRHEQGTFTLRNAFFE